jgi:hypothetical protein
LAPKHRPPRRRSQMGLVAAIGTAVTAVAASAGVAVAATALTVGFETIAAVGAVVSALWLAWWARSRIIRPYQWLGW